MKLFNQLHVRLVVGFGSFHSFPLLAAARFKKVPLVLFEPNAFPGKVNRLFAKKACFTAVLFDEMGPLLKGKIKRVHPLVHKMEKVDRLEAANYFSLCPDKSTLLIFGGSQGAKGINAYIKAFLSQMAVYRNQWQILHFTGNKENHNTYESHYKKLGIRACVKSFEEKMNRAWSLADLVISRSGAGTVAEALHFGVPSLFIPFPFATDDHQTKNAHAAVKSGLAICFKEREGGEKELLSILEPLLKESSIQLKEMKDALKVAQEKQDQPHLSTLILKEVEL